MAGESVKNANEIRAYIKSAFLDSVEVQRTFMLTYALFMVIVKCPFPQFAEG